MGHVEVPRPHSKNSNPCTMVDTIGSTVSGNSANMGFVIFAVSLTIYTVALVAVLYFCVFADPDESATARFLTETLPGKTWQLLERTLGPKALNVVEFFVDRTLLVLYCVIVFGSWSIIFAHVYPWIDAQEYVSSRHKYAGVAIFAACVSSWRLACRSSPGVITARNIQRYDHFPYDHLMYVPGQMCKTRNIPRLARSKFDRFKYHENVPRFDHFCGWVYNTIGEENYRFFLLFLAVHVGMCAYGSYVVGNLFFGEVLEKNLLQVKFFDRYTGEDVSSGMFIIFQYLFNKYVLEAGVLAVMSVMCAALGLFLCYHISLTSRGLTTNESYKWSQVMKWYGHELRRYNDAVKKGEFVLPAPNMSVPLVSDAGLTCTPGTREDATNSNEAFQPDDAMISHPGPKPINMYNRGFVENWKEVIFPLSLRPNPGAASHDSKKDA